MERGATLFKENGIKFRKACQPSHDKTERRTSREEILVLDIRGAASFRKEVAENANAKRGNRLAGETEREDEKHTTVLSVGRERSALTRANDFVLIAIKCPDQSHYTAPVYQELLLASFSR